MKRTIITIAASLLALIPYSTFAQESNAGRSDEFHGHWFIQAQGGIGATVGETKFGDLISPMATVSFGYQFTPVWSLRAGIGGCQCDRIRVVRCEQGSPATFQVITLHTLTFTHMHYLSITSPAPFLYKEKPQRLFMSFAAFLLFIVFRTTPLRTCTIRTDLRSPRIGFRL